MALQKRWTGSRCRYQCKRKSFSDISARHWPATVTWQQRLFRLQTLVTYPGSYRCRSFMPEGHGTLLSIMQIFP
jgi:hypothetical protein